MSSNRKRKECRLCAYDRFTIGAELETIKGHTGRARFFTKQAKFYMSEIENSSRLSVLHPCPEHRATLIRMRQEISKKKRKEIDNKLTMIENTSSLYQEALEKFAILSLKLPPDSPVLVKAGINVKHYRTVLSQRERRVKELTKKDIPSPDSGQS